jgi:hypothetical protein
MATDTKLVATPNVLLRWADLDGFYPGKKTKLYLDIKKGLWTPAIRFSHKISVWPAHEVRKLVAARAQGYTKDQLRALVKQLIAERGLPLADHGADGGADHLRPGAGRGQGEREPVVPPTK